MITIDIVEDADDIIVATIVSDYATLMLMAEVEFASKSLVLRGLHVHGTDVAANELGVAGLRRLLREAMELLDVEEIRIEGARRTSGAGPGRTPRALRFARALSAQGRAKQD